MKLPSHILVITPAEWKLIDHRLELTDCLVEVLAETFGWAPEDIQPKVEMLQCKCDLLMETNGRIALDLSTMDPITLEILKDTMEGSTYLAIPWEDEIALGNVTKGAHLSAQKAANSLEAKMAAAGHRVSIPRS